jgi:hypothetical protein
MPLHTTARLAGWLAVTIGIGAGVFWGASALVGSSERVALLGMLPSRRSR